MVGDFAQSDEDILHLRQIGVVLTFLIGLAVGVLTRQERDCHGDGILKERVDRVEPEAGDSTLVPEAGDIEHGVFHLGIAPVEVGLLGIKKVVIVLIGLPSNCQAEPPKVEVQLLGG